VAQHWAARGETPRTAPRPSWDKRRSAAGYVDLPDVVALGTIDPDQGSSRHRSASGFD